MESKLLGRPVRSLVVILSELIVMTILSDNCFLKWLIYFIPLMYIYFSLGAICLYIRVKCGRKQFWLISGYYPCICMKKIRTNMKNLSQESLLPSRVSNQHLANTNQRSYASTNLLVRQKYCSFTFIIKVLENVTCVRELNTSPKVPRHAQYKLQKWGCSSIAESTLWRHGRHTYGQREEQEQQKPERERRRDLFG